MLEATHQECLCYKLKPAAASVLVLQDEAAGGVSDEAYTKTTHSLQRILII